MKEETRQFNKDLAQLRQLLVLGMVYDEVEQLIKQHGFDCSVDDFAQKVDWGYVSEHCRLSKRFIRRYGRYIDFRKMSGNAETMENL
jgi:hypothetical protein